MEIKERYAQWAKKQDKTDTELRKSHTLVIDGLNTYIRIFAAVPALNDNGDHVGGVIGFLKSLIYYINQFHPTQVVIVFDGKGGSLRRRKIYKDYKGNRKNKITFNRFKEFADPKTEQESFVKQLGRLEEYLNCLPVKLISIDNIEADDVIAYIATHYLTEPDQKVTIVSSDKDFLQLASDRVRVYRPTRKKLYSEKEVVEDFGVSGQNYLLRRCFEGDITDNIPGVKGVAHKTLQKMFESYAENKENTINSLHSQCLQVINDGGKGKTYKNIVDNKSTLERNYKLMQLHDVNIPGTSKIRIFDILDKKPNKLNFVKFRKMFNEDRLFNSIKDVNLWLIPAIKKINAFAVDYDRTV